MPPKRPSTTQGGRAAKRSKATQPAAAAASSVPSGPNPPRGAAASSTSTGPNTRSRRKAAASSAAASSVPARSNPRRGAAAASAAATANSRRGTGSPAPATAKSRPKRAARAQQPATRVQPQRVAKKAREATPEESESEESEGEEPKQDGTDQEEAEGESMPQPEPEDGSEQEESAKDPVRDGASNSSQPLGTPVTPPRESEPSLPDYEDYDDLNESANAMIEEEHNRVLSRSLESAASNVMHQRNPQEREPEGLLNLYGDGLQARQRDASPGDASEPAISAQWNYLDVLADVQASKQFTFEGNEAMLRAQLRVHRDPTYSSRMGYRARFDLTQRFDGTNLPTRTHIAHITAYRIDKPTPRHTKQTFQRELLDVPVEEADSAIEETAMCMQAIYYKNGNLKPPFRNRQRELLENNLMCVSTVQVFRKWQKRGLISHVLPLFHELLMHRELPEWLFFTGTIVLNPAPLKGISGAGWGNMTDDEIFPILIRMYKNAGLYEVWEEHANVGQRFEVTVMGRELPGTTEERGSDAE